MPPVVDSHQHFWDISLRSYHFMPEGDSVLKQNRYPSDLKPLMDEVGVDLCVTVQAHASVEETRWLLKLAAENDFVAGVVGWVDLQDPNVGRTLDELRDDVHFKGVRHIWHDEPDEGWIVRPDVIRGLKELAARGIPYDFLPRPPHLPFIPQVIDKVPELSGVVDHIGKP
ncbi:MAG: amidohydrolase family protein, partial [Chloroflexota bacterium]